MPSFGLPLQQPKRVLDCIDQRPVEREQLTASSPRQNDPGHESAVVPSLGQLAVQVLERHGLVPLQLRQPGL